MFVHKEITVSYSVHSSGHLARARKCLDQQSHDSLFYAALELRSGIESRLQEYLEPHEHVSKSKKKDWQIGKLGKTVEQTFGSSDTIVEMSMHEPETGEHIHTFYYVPVSSSLQKMAERLGGYLHGQQEHHDDSDPWWTDLRDYLESVYSELESANKGSLIGAPLRERGTNNMRMYRVM